jgi:hypothetical protein
MNHFVSFSETSNVNRIIVQNHKTMLPKHTNAFAIVIVIHATHDEQIRQSLLKRYERYRMGILETEGDNFERN